MWGPVTKIAIVSDAHLFQTFAETYDSVKDFERAIEQINTDAKPDVLFLAGDMFDYKKTETMYLRHYEGEGYMITVREILKKFGKQVHAIKGNHDREEVLKGLEQTIGNFHYVGNSVHVFNGVSICFMNSFYETGGGYEASTVRAILEFLKHTVSRAGKKSSKIALLCHETFAPYDNAVPATLVEFLKRNFDMVLNGHMHFWKPSTYGSSRIICLPSLLPSKIAKGKYAMERYDWRAGSSEYQKMDLDSPFGYVILETETLEAEVHQFMPSKKIVEIVLEVTDVGLEEARKRMRSVLSAIDNRPDKKDLIILPGLIGKISFSPLYLENVKEEFPELWIEDIRFNETTLTTTLGSSSLTAPTLTVQQLFEKLKANVPEMVRDIKAKGIEIDEKMVSETLNTLLNEELIIKSQSVSQTKLRLQMVLIPVIDTLGKSNGQKKPSNLEDILSNLLKMVR